MQNKEQFENLFRCHYEQMLMLARLLLKDDEEAKDVVNDVFTEVWEGTINPYVEKSKGFLLTCIRNRCLDLLRHLQIKDRICQMLTLEDSFVMTPTEDDSLSTLERIREIVDTQLPPKDREILLMKYEKKKKYREIALELGISETAVYKHLSNALRTLKENLKNE
jgi:RNA polymerase sigma-70 factor (family 1)